MIIHAKKNEAYELAFPMPDATNPEDFKTGETVTDTGYYKDGAGAWTSLAITDTAAEIGTTGVYEISLTAAEMNHDWVIIKLTSTNSQDTMISIKTYTNDVDDLATASALTTVDTEVGQIKAVTDLLPDSGALSSLATASALTTVDTEVGQIKAVTDLLPDAGALSSLATASALSTAQADLDTITGTDGVTLATAQALYAPAKAGDAMDLVANAVDAAAIATGAIDADAIAASALDGKGDWNTTTPPTAAAISDAVWDEVITGGAHNVNNSSAKFLREASEAIAGTTGTAQGSGTGNNQIQLASGAVASNDIFNNERITIIEGTGAGQSRLIQDSVASTDTLTLFTDWVTLPSTDSVYAIMGAETDIRAINGQQADATATVDFDDLAAILVDTAAIDTNVNTLVADSPNTITKGVQLDNLSFLMVDETNFATPETGLSVSAFVQKDAGAFAPATNSVVEIANGLYRITLTSTEMDADVVNLRFTATGAADRFMTIHTQPT